MKTEIIFGPPGTGKTTELLRIIESLLTGGVKPEKIAYLSFTRKATEEAVDRAIEAFGFCKNQFPYFRTLHSLAFSLAGMRRERVMQPNHYKEVCESLSIEYTGRINLEDGSGSEGDQYLTLIQLARSKGQGLKETWSDSGSDLDWHDLDLFSRTLDQYKKSNHLYDFADMIDTFIKNKLPNMHLDALIVDEAQDLSTTQWQMIDILMGVSERVYIAGDDDQAIYQWSGADVKRFMSIKGEKRVLGKSYRLPQQIFDFSKSISDGISQRVSKTWEPVSAGGCVEFHPSLHDIDISEGSWLLLARNKYLMNDLFEFVKYQGFGYSSPYGSAVNRKHLKAIKFWEYLRRGGSITNLQAKDVVGMIQGRVVVPRKDRITLNDLEVDGDLFWHDALDRIPAETREYYLTILRNGERLDQEPRIHINTIHGVKGGEADNVLLISDMSYRTWKDMEENPDGEHRVFYVGATRARKNLHILEPQSNFFYNF